MNKSTAAMTSPEQGRTFYRTMVLRRQLILLGLLGALFLSFCVDLALGPARYELTQVLSALLTPGSVSEQIRVIVWQIRMPVALMAIVVGASLSIAGAQMQTILSNPLASPFTLGISAGAGFGAALALAFGVSIVSFTVDYIVPTNAFLVAMLTALMIHLLSMRRGVTIETIVLLGIAMVFIFNALMALIQFFQPAGLFGGGVLDNGQPDQGDLAQGLGIACGLASAIPLPYRHGWALTAMRLGDARAESMGVRPRRLRLQVLMLVSLLALVSVAFVGTIGFIGLVGPHIARMLVGEDQRFFLPASALCGALILSVGSVISKMLIPGTVIPIGIITSLVGIPFFLFLVLKQKKSTW